MGASAHVADHVNDFAVLHNTDSLSIDVADVKSVIGSDVHRASRFRDEVGPLFEEFPVRIEHLNAAILRIGDKDPSFGIENHRMRQIKLTRAGPLGSADDLDEFPVL